MRTETDPVTGTVSGAAALGVEERSDETPRGEVGQDRSAPDPEVVAKPTRRQFTAEYRLRIVEEADRCTRPGEVGRLLRREGLYTSHLAAWRKARRSGSLQGLTPKKRGAKPAERNLLCHYLPPGRIPRWRVGAFERWREDPADLATPVAVDPGTNIPVSA